MREQSKPEAALGDALATMAIFLFRCESSWFRHSPHVELTIEHRDPNLNEQVCALICSAHLPLFCDPQRSGAGVDLISVQYRTIGTPNSHKGYFGVIE
jgi:hypothetical protein